MRESLGVVEFVDLDTLLSSQVSLSRLEDGGIALFMDQNTSPKGGWGGDCEVGFDKEAAPRLLEFLREVQRIAIAGPRTGWEPCDTAVECSWCDSDEPENQAQGSVHVSALGRRGVVRLVISPRRNRGEYTLTMPLDAASRLAELVRLALARVR